MTTFRLGRSPWLTPTETADHLRVTLKALRRRMERGTVPGWTYTRMGGSLRFSRSALDQWLNEARERKQRPQRIA